MVKIYFSVSNLTTGSAGADIYKLFEPVNEETVDYLEYDRTNMYIDSTEKIVYAKVDNFAGEVLSKIPSAPNDGDESPPFNIIYNDDEWYYMIGAN